MEQENMSQIVLKDEKYFNIHRNSLMSLSDAGIECASKCKFFMVEIPNYITDICDDAFTDCYNLIDIKIPDGVTRIGDYAFASCTGLRKITFPDSLVSIGENAFMECSDLTEITISKSVLHMGGDEFLSSSPFGGCTSLKTIKVDKCNPIFTSRDWDGDEIDGVVEKSNNALIIGCKNTIIPNGITEIREEAFCGCICLTKIFIPKSVVEIGRFAFSHCTKLKNIYCEAEKKPNGWDSRWNDGCKAKVIWGHTSDMYVDKMFEELFTDYDNQIPKERNDEIILYDNETKFGNLIEWLRMGNNVGINPFKRIPDCPGIYKIFVLDEDCEQIKFGAAETVNGKLFCPTFTRNDGRVVKVTVTNAAELQKRFTDLNDNVIYIGKATSLKKRLRQYAQMALGGHSHRGGIDIFAVQDYDKYLHVAWYPLKKEYATADEWETAEIERFKQKHFGQRPLANRAK